MSLEDFFTLAEMNNGLTSPARVKELVAVIQKEKDCVVKNIGDATRQWSAVASAIAATENKECLDLFIQLDGLWYLNRWLKDAEPFGDKRRDSFLEDSITDLLRALERLQVDNDKSISSGIWMTVKNLLGHNSSKVQDSAKALLNSWKNEKENNAAPQGIEKVGTLADEGTGVTAEHVGEGAGPVSSSRDINASMGSLTVEEQDEASKDDLAPIDSKTLEAEAVSDGQNRSLKNAIMKEEKSHSTGSPSLLKPSNENLHISCRSEDATSTETCSTAGLRQGTQEERTYAPAIDSTDDVKQIQKTGSSPEKFDKEEVSKSTLSTDATDALKSATEPSTVKKSDAVERDYDSKVSSLDGQRTVVSKPKSRMDDDISSSYCRSSIVFGTKEDGECNSDVMQESNTSELKLENSKGSCTLLSMNENDGAVEGVDEDIKSDQGEGGSLKDYDFSKPRMRSKDRPIDKKSDFEMDYGIVDPLEVARQVAIEVEREVEDCRELSCSSSEKELGSKVQQPQSPHSVTGKQCQIDESSALEAPNGPDLSVDSPIREDPATSAANREAQPISVTQDAESSQLTEAAQEVEVNTGKGPSHFDLNQEVCSEDMDRPGDCTSSPISVVSASRAAAAPGMPFAPLQFEGTLGWRGSAATSAFRPASPRRVPENDTALSAGGSNSSSKQNHGFLNFDLNVAESGDDRIADVQTGKQIPVSTRLASGESSAEASPRRSQGFEFDLNRVSDDGDAPSAWQPERELFHRRNGHHSQSPSSSSSKQSSLRNIDLNDQPTFANDSSSNHRYSKSFQNLGASGGIKSDESVISIMGMRVEVNRKDSAARFLPLPNGRISEHATDVNLARTGSVFGIGSPVPYSHPPVYGYNGFSAGPALHFSSPVYGPGGPIPYMVDSRGTPIVPQLMGSSSALPVAFPQPPFVFSMNGAPGSNGVGPLRNNFDLNLGSILEGGNRESGGLRQLFNPGQARSMDEHLKSNLQPSTSSGSGGKRKEPDTGWELYPFKHHSQPWR